MTVDSPAVGGRRFSSWLDRLAALVLPRKAPPASIGPRPPPARGSTRSGVTPRSRALAGRVAIGLVHDINNALLVAVAGLDLIAETPEEAVVVGSRHRPPRGAASRLGPDPAAGEPRLARRRLAPTGGPRRRRARQREARGAGHPAVHRSLGVLPDALLPVHVDRSQIEQAILNCAERARRHAGRRDPPHHDASAYAGCRREGGDRGRVPVTYAVVEVSDTGRASREELQSRVFEPFFTTKAPDQGSGLGLAMYATVLAHGGLVGLTSDALGTRPHSSAPVVARGRRPAVSAAASPDGPARGR